MSTSKEFRITSFASRVDPPAPPADPPPAPPQPPIIDDAVARAQFEADSARAEAARMKKQLEELMKQVPNDEQRAKYAELEAQAIKDAEEKARKSGEFDKWRQQINEKHESEMSTAREATANAEARAAAREKELNDTLVGLAFSNATEWFGPQGKTVMLPEVAQSYFGRYVSVEVASSPNGGPDLRRVLVRDYSNAVIVDAKTGKPADFTTAIGELIERHPQKNQLLRGSMKVGSGSTGGDRADGGRDLSRLKPEDFRDANVRSAVRDSLGAPGGLRSPGFEAIERLRREKKS